MLGKFAEATRLVQRWSGDRSREGREQVWVLVAEMGGLGKEAALNCLGSWDCNAGEWVPFPGSGRSPGEGNSYPLQCSCLGNPMDRDAWQATVHGVTKSLSD